MKTNMGIAGTIRVVKKNSKDEIVFDSGEQKNLILNQGLDFFGGGNGSDMMSYCVIGAGNSTPTQTQNKLDSIVKKQDQVITSGSKHDYDQATDGQLYKTNRTLKYSFNFNSNVNVSEIGLASEYYDSTDYYLCTRALIKDSNGDATTVSLADGEILEVYYTLWQVYNLSDINGQINLLDGKGGAPVAYNYIVRLMRISFYVYSDLVGASLSNRQNGSGNLYEYRFYNGELGDIFNLPAGRFFNLHYNSYSLSNYTTSSYKRIFSVNAGVTHANGTIRSVSIPTTMGVWQIRYGSVADDSPIIKTDQHKLTLPFEFSWSRYEGAL